jgi:ATP-binding cassette subfamily B (MDR/TAP) protein 6
MQQLFAPLNFFGSYYRMIQNAALDMEGVFRLLETEAKIQDHPKSAPFMGNNHEITFDNVSFAYHGVNSAVLNNISLTIPHGKTCSLVGQTGSGKSTILRLLLRLYDPLEGWISIGGQPLSRITLSSLRSLISVVPQDTVLFNDTIWYNIKYGYPDASDEDVIAAAKGACLYDTIMNKFPAGFETRVGERGLRLSGGEKQRVAFARAILKNPPILILDEATSSLDSITEHRIQEVLLSKRKDRTVLLVAHRLSTIADCDRIIVVEHGKIIEMGTHEELLENKRTYSQLWNKQNLSSSH